MSHITLKLLALSFILTIAGTAYAYNATGLTRISQVVTYSEYGAGDVTFSVANPIPECNSGYWLRKSDPGFQATLNTVLSAFHARSTVMVFGLPNELWSGSAGKYCRVHGLALN
jgi:hypothetical protein